MSLSRIFEYFVEFSVKGVESVKSAIGNMQADLSKAAEAVAATGAQTQSSFAAGAQAIQALTGATAQATRATAGQAGAAAALGTAFGGMGTVIAAVVEKVQAFEKAVQVAFESAISVVKGLASAGLAASAMGQALSTQMDLLARTVGGLLTPEIQQLTRGIASVRDWINNLTDAQKDAVAQAGLMAATFYSLKGSLGVVGAGVAALLVGTEDGRKAIGELMKAFGEVLPTLAAAGSALANAIAPALKVVAEAIAEVVRLAEPFLGFFAKLVGLVGGAVKKAFEAVGEVVKRVAAGMRGVLEGAGLIGPRERPGGSTRRQPLSPRLGGFESLTASYDRVAQASMVATSHIGQSVEQQQLAAQNGTNERLDALRQDVQQLRPAMV